MSMHLSQDELSIIIQKTPQHLASNRYLHYEKCAYCRASYKQQIAIHKPLLNIKNTATNMHTTKPARTAIS